ncbi:hypothetical protein Q6312_28480, partial [Klebsiella pneumoniae]|uniref:hypothetical protein n=1 Tax=Klebsiella pneumoniae TaxID=573 RepID=UPI002731E02E
NFFSEYSVLCLIYVMFSVLQFNLLSVFFILWLVLFGFEGVIFLFCMVVMRVILQVGQKNIF